MKRFYQILLIFVCLLVFEFSTFAQPSSIVTPTPTPTPPTESEARKLETDIEDVFRIKKRKSSVSNPGDFGDVGVLNIGYSYGGYYR